MLKKCYGIVIQHSMEEYTVKVWYVEVIWCGLAAWYDDTVLYGRMMQYTGRTSIYYKTQMVIKTLCPPSLYRASQ